MNEQQPSRYTFDPHSADGGSSHGIMLSLIGRDRDVLDVGCAAGDLARALRKRGCLVSGIEYDPVAAEAARPSLENLVIGDLEAMDLDGAIGGQRFDVVVFGDVLEHLRDPLAVLRQAPGLLRPGGSVVLSIPNVAHAAVRLSLLNGDFTYRELGLLDETHLRFFTRASVMQLLEQAGLVAVDVRRTVLGPFDSEIPLRAEDVPGPVLDHVMADPEAITYQFVLEAVVDDVGGRERARALAVDKATMEADRLRASVASLEAELEAVRPAVDRLTEQLGAAQAALTDARQTVTEAARVQLEKDSELSVARQEARQALSDAHEARAGLAAVHNSTAWRVSAPVRRLGPLRAALQGPMSQRRSLRQPGALTAAVKHVREQGLVATVQRARAEVNSADDKQAYAQWVERYDTLSERDVTAIKRHISDALADGHVFSVVVPVYETEPVLLRAAVDSVLTQLYPRWQLVLSDDGSSKEGTRQLLDELTDRDPRITVLRRPANGGIAVATNDGLRAATGDFVAFFDHDDVLAPHAMYAMAVELQEHPESDLVYSDEDKLDWKGQRYDPHFKPDYNAELLLGQNYISHLTVVRRSLLEAVGGLDEGLDGSQDHDLVLRLIEASSPERVRHVPQVLYHWRQWSGSQTYSSLQLERATAASREAVTRHLARTGQARACVEPAPRAAYWNRVRRPLPSPLSPVTAVVPTRDRLCLLRECVTGLLERTDYEALRVLIVDNDSTEPETLAWLTTIADDPRVRVLRVPGPFNYAAINNTSVAEVETPLVLLLNNDIFVREPHWLQEMVGVLSVPGTGAVGAKLLYGDGRLQHAGVILGIGGVAGHSHKYFPQDSIGYFGRLALSQDVSAVTAACLLMPTALFRSVGGLDAEHLSVAFNDVDLCLRIGAAGHRVVWTPHAELDHLESASRGPEATPEQVRRFNSEIDYMKRRWGNLLNADPAYNPNLTDSREDFTLAEPPRVNRPWAPYLA